MKTLTLSFIPRHCHGCRNTVTNRAAGDQCLEALQEHGKKCLGKRLDGRRENANDSFFRSNGDVFFGAFI